MKNVIVFGDFYLKSFCCCHQREKVVINFKPEADSDKKAGEDHEPQKESGIPQEQGDQDEYPQEENGEDNAPHQESGIPHQLPQTESFRNAKCPLKWQPMDVLKFIAYAVGGKNQFLYLTV